MTQFSGPREGPSNNRSFGAVTLVDGLTADAFLNREKVTEELKLRRELGLASAERLEPSPQIERYLAAVERSFPEVFALAAGFARQTPPWTKAPEIVVALPIAGFGGQEHTSIVRTLELLGGDPLVAAGRAQIVIFGNRPPTESADDIGEVIDSACRRLGMSNRVDFIAGEIGFELGRTASPLIDYVHRNKPPMGLVRDLISITTMVKLRPLMAGGPNPVILQMDADFEGFRRGSLSTVLSHFEENPSVEFVQCTSDWESRQTPTGTDALFKLGCDLMREIPMRIKECTGDRSLSETMLQQAVFGELIQRGVQVPQAETAASIARKGGYGLLRLSDDELDANLRFTYRPEVRNIAVGDDVIFLWDSRRALAAWASNTPPISQWKSADFLDVDPVRTNVVQGRSDVGGAGSGRILGLGAVELTDEVLDLVNKTLKRTPIPSNLLDECLVSGDVYVRGAIARCGILLPESIILERIDVPGGNEIFQLVRRPSSGESGRV